MPTGMVRPAVVVVNSFDHTGYRRDKTWIALAVIAGVVLSTAFGFTAIAVSAIVGVVIMMLTGCLEVEEGLQSVHWEVILLLAGMIPLGLNDSKQLSIKRRTALAEELAARWRAAGRGGDVLTWVPVHPSRRRERGFDQAEELARAMASRLDLPVRPWLQRRQRTTAQHSLGQAERAGNTAGAFATLPGAAPDLASRWVVVVDDIVTTGATLAGCAAALLGSGAAAVSAVTVARDR